MSFFFSFVFFEEDEKKKDPDEPGNWKMIDTAFIFQVPAHYPVVTFVSSSFFSPSRAREKKEGYNRQIQPEDRLPHSPLPTSLLLAFKGEERAG